MSIQLAFLSFCPFSTWTTFILGLTMRWWLYYNNSCSQLWWIQSWTNITQASLSMSHPNSQQLVASGRRWEITPFFPLEIRAYFECYCKYLSRHRFNSIKLSWSKLFKASHKPQQATSKQWSRVLFLIVFRRNFKQL